MIILLGKPGAGKGTQAELLVKQDKFVWISPGELLRNRAKQDPDLKAIQDSGQLVDSRITNQLIKESILAHANKRVILDGFPRNREQANWLKKFLAEHPTSNVEVIVLEISDDEVKRRLAGRGRADDDPGAIQRRLSIYDDEASYIYELIHGIAKVYTIDGSGSIDAVHERIRVAIAQDEGL